MATDYILFDYIPNKSDIAGFFDPDDKNIYINKRLSLIKRQFTLIHEAQHKYCYLNDCSCWYHSTCFWCEYHAYRAELRFVLLKNTKRYWTYYLCMKVIELKKLILSINKVDSWKSHILALRKVCLLKDSIKYAKKYGYWKEIQAQLRRVPK